MKELRPVIINSGGANLASLQFALSRLGLDVPVTTDAEGLVSFDVTLNASTTAGEAIAFTATGPDGSTSEFSANRTALANFIVSNTDDSGIGSLRGRTR